MDITYILRDAINQLKTGEHSAGLTAILRHIDAAVRHFQRKSSLDPDSFTDCIYRANQAYEGSLKEAFRVLAEKNPSGKSPHEIEKYLENNAILRPRVLTQLRRYRQDYRNPAAHEYNLDFDEAEALLAILSVCAFCKLLVDQIAVKLSLREILEFAESLGQNVEKFQDKEELSIYLTNIIGKFIRSDILERYISTYEFEENLRTIFTNRGFEVGIPVVDKLDDRRSWSIVLNNAEFNAVIDTRWSPGGWPEDFKSTFKFIINGCRDEKFVDIVILVIRNDKIGAYNLKKLSRVADKDIFFICKFDEEVIMDYLANEHNGFECTDMIL